MLINIPDIGRRTSDDSCSRNSTRKALLWALDENYARQELHGYTPFSEGILSWLTATRTFAWQPRAKNTKPIFLSATTVTTHIANYLPAHYQAKFWRYGPARCQAYVKMHVDHGLYPDGWTTVFEENKNYSGLDFTLLEDIEKELKCWREIPVVTRAIIFWPRTDTRIEPRIAFSNKKYFFWPR